MYVANAATGANANGAKPNYTGFTIEPRRAPPAAGRTRPSPLPIGSQPADVLFNGPGTSLVGTRAGTSEIDSFVVGRNGLLTAAPDSPLPAQGLGPFGSEFRPTNPEPAVRVQRPQRRSRHRNDLRLQRRPERVAVVDRGYPFADDQTAPCWIEITHDGQFLFTVNTGSGEISRYSIAHDGTLTLLGSTPVGNTGGVGAVDARLSPDGRFLFVDESRIGAVGVFAVNGGNLTEVAGSPTALPGGATPAGIVSQLVSTSFIAKAGSGLAPGLCLFRSMPVVGRAAANQQTRIYRLNRCPARR